MEKKSEYEQIAQKNRKKQQMDIQNENNFYKKMKIIYKNSEKNEKNFIILLTKVYRQGKI